MSREYGARCLAVALVAIAASCNERALLRTTTERVAVPPSNATTLPPPGALRFFLRKDALYVDGSEVPIVRRATDRTVGFFADDERRRWPGDLELPALGMVADSFVARHAWPAALLEIDGGATYREAAGLISTVARHGMDVWLAVDHRGERRAISIPLQMRGKLGAPITAPCLLVTMDEGEIRMGTADVIPAHSLLHTEPPGLGCDCDNPASPFVRTIARGCLHFGAGPAIAALDGAYDVEGFIRCGAAINHFADGALGQRIVVPQAATPFRALIAMHDALLDDNETRGGFVLMAPPTPAP